MYYKTDIPQNSSYAQEDAQEGNYLYEDAQEGNYLYEDDDTQGYDQGYDQGYIKPVKSFPLWLLILIIVTIIIGCLSTIYCYDKNKPYNFNCY